MAMANVVSPPPPKKILKMVELSPVNELTYKYSGKMTVDRKEDLTIYNPTEQLIAFKMKGTSPKIIKIIPGYGYLKPEGRVAIWVIVKPNADGVPPYKEHVTVLLSLVPAQHPNAARKFWEEKPEESPLRKEQINLKFVEYSLKKSPPPPESSENEADEDDKEN